MPRKDKDMPLPDRMKQRPWPAFNGSIELAPVCLDLLVKLQMETGKRQRGIVSALLLYCAEVGDQDAMAEYVKQYGDLS